MESARKIMSVMNLQFLSMRVVKKFRVNIYIMLSPGENNKIFGFSIMNILAYKLNYCVSM